MPQTGWYCSVQFSGQCLVFDSVSVGDVVPGVDVASSSSVVAGDDVDVGDGCDGSVGAAVGIVAVVVGIMLSDSTIIFAFKTHLLDTVSENTIVMQEIKKNNLTIIKLTSGAPAHSHSRVFILGKDRTGESFALDVVCKRLESESSAILHAMAPVCAMACRAGSRRTQRTLKTHRTRPPHFML